VRAGVDDDDYADLRVPRDATELSWWLPARVLQLPPSLSYRLLRSRRVNERLAILATVVESLAAQASRQQMEACAVQ